MAEHKLKAMTALGSAVAKSVDIGPFYIVERFDVAFANRYFEAFDRAWREEQTTQSWRVAFHAASQWSPVILQHLLD